MARRSFLTYLILLLLPFQMLLADSQKPNIILILVDDMGWGDLGVYHQNQRLKENKAAIQTPQLDQLASEGMQLRRHYTASPVCAPARASLFTGVHQGHARTVRDNSFDIPLENTHTLASTLKQAGYSTALIGKWGLGGGEECGGNPSKSSAYPTKRGFDFFFGFLDHIAGHRHYPYEDPADKRSPGKINQIWEMNDCITANLAKCYSTDLLTARAKKWIIDERKTTPNKPFFLALTLIAPHASLEVPTQAYPQGGGINGGVQWLGTPNKMINTATGKIDSFIYPQYRNKKLPEAAQRHATMISRIDDAVGDIITLLKDLKIEQNTLIVFTSDNGPHNEGSFLGIEQDPQFYQSYGPFDGIKRDVLEGGIRVPTIVKWPKSIKPGISDNPSQFQDWMPTFLAAANVPAPAISDGVSLLPTLLKKGKQESSNIYIEYAYPSKTPPYKDFNPTHRNQQQGQQQVVYIGPYKGMRRKIQTHQDLFEIYNTATDPQESNNLADTPEGKTLQQAFHDQVLQMRRVYDYSHIKRGSFAARPYDNALIPAKQIQTPAEEGFTLKVLPRQITPWPANSAFFERIKTASSTQNLNIPAYPQGAMLQFTSWINIPKDGNYIFSLKTKNSSPIKAFVHLHQAQLIDADNNYQAGEKASSYAAIGSTEKNPDKTNQKAIPLQAGWHPICISCSVSPSSQTNQIELFWTSKPSTEEPIPSNAFYTHK